MKVKLYNAILKAVFVFLHKMPHIEYRPPSYRRHIKLINGRGPYDEGEKIPDDVISRPFIPSLISTVNVVKNLSVPPRIYVILRSAPSYSEEQQYIRCRLYLLNEYDMGLLANEDHLIKL